jgi:hypothetical protein
MRYIPLLLLAGALSIASCENNPVIDTPRTSTLTIDERVDKFMVGEGLPGEFHKPGWGDYPGFINEQKAILKGICLYGKYHPELGADRYVGRDTADGLLRMYGWNLTK